MRLAPLPLPPWRLLLTGALLTGAAGCGEALPSSGDTSSGDTEVAKLEQGICYDCDPYEDPEDPEDPPPPPPPPPPIIFGAACGWGQPDCNRCVPDVAAAVRNLRSHGDVMGFGNPPGEIDSLSKSHWQGVQRLQGGGGRYLAITHSAIDVPPLGTYFYQNPVAPFSIVKMESRASTGARFRSNRLSSAIYPFTAPPWQDRLVTQAADTSYGYQHAGGLQVLGNYLVVPLEASPKYDYGFNYVEPHGRLLFYDVTNPEAPVKLPPEVSSGTASAGVAALTKLSNGRFLLMFPNDGGANQLRFYTSTTGTLASSDFTFFDEWRDDPTEVNKNYAFEFGNYQSLNFITQCDGTLFLAGTSENTKFMIGQDWLDLYKVSEVNRQIRLDKVEAKHLYCGYPSPTGLEYDSRNVHCNFDAGGGVYVDPNGELIVYATEHGRDGPSGTVKAMEFRSIFPNPQCGSDINEAFIELYDDSTFSDRGIMIDFRDRNLRNYANFNSLEGFNDKTSAVRYCIPPGWRFRLHDDDNFSDTFKDFTGRGSVNLNDIGFGDKASSGRWLNF